MNEKELEGVVSEEELDAVAGGISSNSISYINNNNNPSYHNGYPAPGEDRGICGNGMIEIDRSSSVQTVEGATSSVEPW